MRGEDIEALLVGFESNHLPAIIRLAKQGGEIFEEKGGCFQKKAVRHEPDGERQKSNFTCKVYQT
jgi:hypothetical protein